MGQFLKEWGISGQEKTLSEKEGAIGFPGNYGMIWLETEKNMSNNQS